MTTCDECGCYLDEDDKVYVAYDEDGERSEYCRDCAVEEFGDDDVEDLEDEQEEESSYGEDGFRKYTPEEKQQVNQTLQMAWSL